MLLMNRLPDHGLPIDEVDAALLGAAGAAAVGPFLGWAGGPEPTPMVALPGLARAAGVASIHVKDEGQRLGLGSFKALGGAFAVVRLVMEEASGKLGRAIDYGDLRTPPVQAIAAGMTFGCATDGNHGRSVAWGAEAVGAQSVIFVHAGVSANRIDAIARFGATIVRVAGNYDDSVAEAAATCAARGWTVVSDTSWPGYERIPGMVMQGYAAMVAEALAQLPQAPTHVFIQAGVGGVAAAVAGHMGLVMGEGRPCVVVVEPALAGCVMASAAAGRVVSIAPGEATVMAMLECYEPSLIAWRVVARAADAFMTVEDDDAVAAMRALAFPTEGDPAMVAGESGCAGLAGLMRIAADPDHRRTLGLGSDARVLLFNTEGATDPRRYRELVVSTPQG